MERKAGSGRPVTATTQENGDLVEELRPFKRIKTPHMSEVTHQQRTDRAGKLAARFERNLRLIEKCAFQDGKDITLEVPLNQQNNCIYFKGEKKDVPEANIFHHSNRRSKKVMVSACLTWNGATKSPFS